jgi:hypothetical protein
MTNPSPSHTPTTRPRLLSEEWLPTAESGAESARERRSHNTPHFAVARLRRNNHD